MLPMVTENPEKKKLEKFLSNFIDLIKYLGLVVGLSYQGEFSGFTTRSA